MLKNSCVLSLLLFSTVSFADKLDTLYSNTPTNCSKMDLSKEFGDKRYVALDVGRGGSVSQILYDEKTIKIDKKNKIIEVWTIWLVTESFSLEMTGGTQMGYTKFLDVFDYKQARKKRLSSVVFGCNADSPPSRRENYESEFELVIPGSIADAVLEALKRKYKLN